MWLMRMSGLVLQATTMQTCLAWLFGTAFMVKIGARIRVVLACTEKLVCNVWSSQHA